MNDNNIFDAPDPIFTSDDTEDIGAPLTAGTSFNFGARPSNTEIHGLSSDSTALYVFYLDGSNQTYFIRKFSFSGINDSTYGTNGRLSISNPTPPAIYSSTTFSSFRRQTFKIANNKIYIVAVFSGRRSLEVFNLSTGAHESHLYPAPHNSNNLSITCLLYTSPSPRD